MQELQMGCKYICKCGTVTNADHLEVQNMQPKYAQLIYYNE